MTMFAETPPPLRDLFERIDFAPRPRHEALARLLDRWAAARQASTVPWPRRLEEGGIAETGDTAFIYARGQDRDYVLMSGSQTLERLLGPCEPGSGLQEAPARRTDQPHRAQRSDEPPCGIAAAAPTTARSDIHRPRRDPRPAPWLPPPEQPPETAPQDSPPPNPDTAPAHASHSLTSSCGLSTGVALASRCACWGR